jgi:hypothetical protein
VAEPETDRNRLATLGDEPKNRAATFFVDAHTESIEDRNHVCRNPGAPLPGIALEGSG